MMILANSGTPLMWLGFLQLLGGNLVIAAVEAAVIRWAFKPQRRFGPIFGIMVLSNYVSFLAGSFLRYLAGDLILDRFSAQDALYYLRWLLVVLFVVSFLLTLILEFPFCLWAVGPRVRRLRSGLKATLASQTVSYLCLLPLVLLASGFSAATAVKADRSLVPQAPNIATVYYLSDQDRSLRRIRLNGTHTERVQDLETKGHEWDKLFLGRGATEKQWDLCIGDYSDHSVLLRNVGDAGLAWGRDGLAWGGPPGEGRPYHYLKPAAALEPPEDRVWDVRAGLYGIEGIIAWNRQTGKRLQVALETPFVTWEPDNPSLLPGDLVVFQLGNQIVLLDLNTQRIGVIAMGRQPVVVLDDRYAPAASTQAAS